MPYLAYQLFCSKRQEVGNFRQLRVVGPASDGRILIQGKSFLNFSSNNYMGLANHPYLKQRSKECLEQWGSGSTASRLVCGTLSLFETLEEKLSRGKKSEAALIFNSGFQANVAILSSLLDPVILKNPLVYSDRLNHASMHQGCQLAGVRQIRYRHNDLNHLEDLLKVSNNRPGPRFILSETVFSMDGDQCDVAGLILLKEKYGAFLYLDEAHATAVLGPDGFGLAAHYPGKVDLVMGTFSKGLGGFGAYAVCSNHLKNFLINRCAGFIYSTALPPSVLGAMDAALDLLPTLQESRKRLLTKSERFRVALHQAGLNTGNSSTQIVPWIVGSQSLALRVSQALEEEGILAVPIRPPTVPKGGSRIRFSLTAMHRDEDLDYLTNTVLRLGASML